MLTNILLIIMAWFIAMPYWLTITITVVSSLSLVGKVLIWVLGIASASEE